MKVSDKRTTAQLNIAEGFETFMSRLHRDLNDPKLLRSHPRSHQATLATTSYKGSTYCLIRLPFAKQKELTTKQKQIVLLIASGVAQKEIAKRLGFAPATMGSHLLGIYRKLRINSRNELIRMSVLFA